MEERERDNARLRLSISVVLTTKGPSLSVVLNNGLSISVVLNKGPSISAVLNSGWGRRGGA